jgi:hypothetical protein
MTAPMQANILPPTFLPGVVASAPRIGHLGAGEFPADGIHKFAAHVFLTLGAFVAARYEFASSSSQASQAPAARWLH